ncbi:MAG: glycosyltransferase [bacterium]|nr:glycosyltransferase [bacterium]
MSLSQAKVALVFDWMTNPGGAEKVNLVLHRMFKDAPIFTSIFNPDKLPGFEKALVHTSFIQTLPFAKTRHQLYLGLMPYAYELFDLSDYDIVISSSHACAKGVITKPETLHLCYCHTPMRYAWDDWHSYISDYKMNPLFKRFAKKRIHKIRMWDRLSADRVDHFIANSTTTQKRIKKYYKRDSEIVHPMIKADNYKSAKHKNYFLAVGRLTPYKRFDLIVDTFNKMGLPLKIVGTGIMENELRMKANDNIEFLGYTNEKHLQILYSECEALIFPQLEDFGITPLESMASGRPVIAYNKGGALDTVIEGKTGIFFDKQDENSLRKGILEYQKTKGNFRSKTLQAHAAKFDEKEFKKNFMNVLRQKWKEHQINR